MPRRCLVAVTRTGSKKMSDAMCRWLNEELRLSQAVEPNTFTKSFSNGYLFGELLHKCQLQKDFSLFTKKDTSISRLNNFTRLEPTLQLLGISFDINTAQELGQEKQGVAIRLLYQLYVSLGKRKTTISRRGMDTKQPAASAIVHRKEREAYSDHLHQVGKRSAELKLQKISQHYEDKSLMVKPVQQKGGLPVLDVQRKKNIGKVPKPPPQTSQSNLKRRHLQQKRAQQAQMVQNEIDKFEKNKKELDTCGLPLSLSGQPVRAELSPGGSSQGCDIPGSGAKMVLQPSTKYIQDIRQRVRENAVARDQREKRLDRFLVEQLKAHEAQEEAQRVEQFVKRLTRQTQQEQRLATQLLQIRRQKEVMRQNRLFREQQYQQRRERDFQEALEKEAALAQQDKLEHDDEIRKEIELSKRNATERAQNRREKHLMICKDILEQIVDLATKVGDYRLAAGNLIPNRSMREWKELLINGLPLYEPIQDQPVSTPLHTKKQEILNNHDYDDYTNMVGVWSMPKEAGQTVSPPTNNDILGHVVGRLSNIVNQHCVEPSSLLFPHFALKACVLGLFCSGKTTCLARIAEGLGVCVLSVDNLIEDALKALQNGQDVSQVSEQQEEKDSEQLQTSSTTIKFDPDTYEKSRDSHNRSACAMNGAALEKTLREGMAISDELLVNIVVEAIGQIPAQTGWILDGFPFNISQARLLEKALGGSDDMGTAVINNRTNLAADPNPPKPPPPPAPVLDVAVLLDISDECLIKRAFSHADPDTAADTTGPTDKTMYQAQTQQRITAFHDTWPQLEKWFGGKQNILAFVDANVDEEELYKRVESILEQIMMKREEEFQKTSTSTTAPPVDHPPFLKDKASAQKKPLPGLKKRAQYERFRPKATSQTFRGCTPEPASPCPVSSNGNYVDEPIPPEIPEYLCSIWHPMCDSYVNNLMTVMQQLRTHHTEIDLHLCNVREEYKQYLRCPDLKQEIVSQWQKDFNSIGDDTREDEETKAELHLRLDELCEHLWDISGKRKENDERERIALMGEAWLDENITLLINHHSALMEVELDRFKSTFHVLKVYYLSMCSQVLPKEFSKIGAFLREQVSGSSIQDPSEIKQDSSPEALETGVEDKQGGTVAQLQPDTSDGIHDETGEDQTELDKPHQILVSFYKEAITTINKLVTEKPQQKEIEEWKKRQQDVGSGKGSKNGKKGGSQSFKDKKEPPSPPPEPCPMPFDDKMSEKSNDQLVKKKIHKECVAALAHEEGASKLRLSLVKYHGVMMVKSLQSRAEQTLSSLQEWLEERYLAEMQSIANLSDVVRQHIETSAKLQNKLVLEYTDFYLNGNLQMVPIQLTSPRLPSLEKPVQSTLTIAQLDTLRHQLYTVAPSGFMSCSEFWAFLRHVSSVNTGRNTWSEPWSNMNEKQVSEIVNLLKDGSGMISWRRFLLSAALPWPLPSLRQLLAVLQGFKIADTGNTGYLNEDQYLQTQLWFSSESIQPVPDDPSEPLPYDRQANLRKFFFRLFADNSISPPRLDYVSMLQYFVIDPITSQNIQTPSLVQDQHLKLSSSGHLVESIPTIGEAAVICSSELPTPCASITSLEEQESPSPPLFNVICDKISKEKDDNPLLPDCLSEEDHTEDLMNILRGLGYTSEDHVLLSFLSKHQELMKTSPHHRLINLHRVLQSRQDEGKPGI